MKKQSIVIYLILGFIFSIVVSCVTAKISSNNNSEEDLFKKLSEDILYNNNGILLSWQTFHKKNKDFPNDQGIYKTILFYNNKNIFEKEMVMRNRIYNYYIESNIIITEISNGIFFYFYEPPSNRNNLLSQIYLNDQFLLNGFEPNYLMTDNNGNVYFSNSSVSNLIVYKNKEIYLSGIDNLKNINGIFYYSKKNGTTSSIYKDSEIIVADIQGLSNFTVSNDGINIAHTIIGQNGNMLLYKNNDLYATSNDMIFWPRFSPDGKKLYYFEAKDGPNYSLLVYARGPEIPPIISGPYTKPTDTEVFIFSNDSKYVATKVFKFSGNDIGCYIILNSILLGPYKNISSNFYFSNDSKYFIYTHDNIIERYELK